MFEKDLTTRLFENHLAHGTAQLDLAKALLKLRDEEARAKRLLAKIDAGGLTEKEADEQMTVSDDVIDKLRAEIKKAVETLLGLPYSCIEEANL